MVDLKTFKNPLYNHGRSLVIRFLWMVVSRLFINTWIPYPSKFKTIVLKLFGAKIGGGFVIRPFVKIKHPWCIQIEDNVWIGESVWIDNLVLVTIGSNVCISQGAFLFTGNHNYKSKSFDLITDEIHLEMGVWIGAQAIVGPGVRCCSNSELAAGSIAFKNLDSNCVYQGNPAEVKRMRN
jgi:putative colanic acid biosynthesis acetyltransferase WcaF